MEGWEGPALRVQVEMGLDRGDRKRKGIIGVILVVAGKEPWLRSWASLPSLCFLAV